MRKTIISIAVTLIVLAGGAFYYFHKSSTKTACTQEAFLCPDGSYVGRTGPSCEFRACPNQDSFIGKLVRSSGEFALIIPSPSNEGGVAYRMPLVLTTSSLAEQLVNQKVRVYGAFIHDAMLSVNKIEALPGSESDPTLGEIGFGKTSFVNGVRITLHGIVQDNRCPAGAQCIRAGSVTTNVSLTSDTDRETVNMESGAPPLQFDSFMISVVNVKPPRVAGSAPNPSAYLITFKVTQG